MLVFAPDRSDGARQPAHGRPGRPAAGHHHPRQRVGEGERGGLLPGHGPAPGDRRGRELQLRDVAACADDAEKRAGTGGARRSAGRTRAAEPAAPADPRPPDRSMGHQGVGCRGEARGPAGRHAARDGAAGRSRAREAREDHPRRGRADRVREAVAGGGRDEPASRWPSRCGTCRRSTEIASEQNSTIIFPLPIDLLQIIRQKV